MCRCPPRGGPAIIADRRPRAPSAFHVEQRRERSGVGGRGRISSAEHSWSADTPGSPDPGVHPDWDGRRCRSGARAPRAPPAKRVPPPRGRPLPDAVGEPFSPGDARVGRKDARTSATLLARNPPSLRTATPPFARCRGSALGRPSRPTGRLPTVRIRGSKARPGEASAASSARQDRCRVALRTPCRHSGRRSLESAPAPRLPAAGPRRREVGSASPHGALDGRFHVKRRRPIRSLGGPGVVHRRAGPARAPAPEVLPPSTSPPRGSAGGTPGRAASRTPAPESPTPDARRSAEVPFRAVRARSRWQAPATGRSRRAPETTTAPVGAVAG